MLNTLDEVSKIPFFIKKKLKCQEEVLALKFMLNNAFPVSHITFDKTRKGNPQLTHF